MRVNALVFQDDFHTPDGELLSASISGEMRALFTRAPAKALGLREALALGVDKHHFDKTCGAH